MQPHNWVPGRRVAVCLSSAGRLAPAWHIHVWVLTQVASPAGACRSLLAPTATTTPAGALLLLPTSRRLRLGTGRPIRACPWHSSRVASCIGAACPRLPRIDLGRGTSIDAATSWLPGMGMRSCGTARGSAMAVTASQMLGPTLSRGTAAWVASPIAAAASQVSRLSLGRGAAAWVTLPASTALDCRLLVLRRRVGCCRSLVIGCRVRLLPLVQVQVAGPLCHEL